MPDKTEQSFVSERKTKIESFLALSRNINIQIVEFFRKEYKKELQVGDNAVEEFEKIKPTILHGSPTYHEVSSIILQMDQTIRLLTNVSGDFMELVDDTTMIILYRIGLEYAKRYKDSQ